MQFINIEKNKLNRFYFKQILFIFLFWIFILISYKILLLLTNNGSIIFDYLIIAPIIILLFYFYFTEHQKRVVKISYILLGIIIPYIFLLIYIYLKIVEGFNPIIL